MKQTLSTSAVARLLGVAVRSVANWIDQGRLKAGRTPGGHRRVEAADLLDFLRRQKLPVPPGLGPSHPKVLVVDDDKAVARWISREIQSGHPDYEVRQAHDGFTAGEIVVSWRPDVVVLDLRMQGMDGYEVCRRIKGREDTRHAAVIAITAYYSAQSRKRILECGARVCLAKPLDAEALLREVETALR